MTWDYTKLKIEIVKRNMTETQFREAVGFSTVILSKINKGKKLIWIFCGRFAIF